MISTVLENATIIDGSGRSGFKTDIAFTGSTIALVGDCSDREAQRRFDCRGKIAAPGFIDACSHSGGKWLTAFFAQNKTTQGIVGEIMAISADSSTIGWEESLNVAEILDLARKQRHGTFGAFLVTDEARIAAEAGGSGVYLDLSRMTFDRALALARESALGGAPRAVVSLRDHAAAITEATGDAIAIAQRANVHVHIANHHAIYPESSGRMERTLEQIDRARSRGASVTCDVAPYSATWIELASLLPAGVTPAMLRDDALVAAVAVEMQARLGERWHDLMLAEVSSEERMEWCGMRIDDIARQTWRSPARTVVDLIRDEGERARAFWFCLREDDVAMALSAEFCAIGTDAGNYAAKDRPFGLVHPRAFGTFPRVFGRFVRQRRTIDEVEAVRRMTALPAQIFGLPGRGTIEPGAAADVVIFDPNRFIDTATYEQPFSLPIGLERLFSAGLEVTVSGGTV